MSQSRSTLSRKSSLLTLFSSPRSWHVRTRTNHLVEELREAIEDGDLEAVKRALAAGAGIDAHCAKGSTPLATAILSRRIDIVKHLLSEGANKQLGYRRTWCSTILDPGDVRHDLPEVCPPLHCATAVGENDLVKLFIQRYGVKANDSSGRVKGGGGITPLFVAVGSTVKLLIDLGANANFSTSSGRTPLLSAIRNRDVDGVRTLCDRGALVQFEIRAIYDVTVWDLVDGLRRERVSAHWVGTVSPLMQACASGRPTRESGDLIKALVDAGADVNHKHNINGSSGSQVPKITVFSMLSRATMTSADSKASEQCVTDQANWRKKTAAPMDRNVVHVFEALLEANAQVLEEDVRNLCELDWRGEQESSEQLLGRRAVLQMLVERRKIEVYSLLQLLVDSFITIRITEDASTSSSVKSRCQTFVNLVLYFLGGATPDEVVELACWAARRKLNSRYESLSKLQIVKLVLGWANQRAGKPLEEHLRDDRDALWGLLHTHETLQQDWAKHLG
jgi:hypothetical protein